MNPAQQFVILQIFVFLFSAWSVFKHGMTPYFGIMTAVLWLGVGVGIFAKIAVEVFK